MRCAHYLYKDLHNAYYEGYTGNVDVTNLFVWNFFGELKHASINYQGIWHDSKLARASGIISPKLSNETPEVFAILGDSAFAVDYRTVNGKIVRGGR